MMHRYH